jgi:HEAT repeat protein
LGTEKRKSLESRLAESSAEVRRQAVLEIIDQPQDLALELLIEALGDDDWRVRKEAAAISVQMPALEETIDRLIAEMTRDRDVGLCNSAVEALANIGEPAIGRIIDRIPTLNAAGRKMAIESIGASNDNRVEPSLIRLLDDEDSNVRSCAAEWLGEHSSQNAEQALLKCLKSSDRILLLVALQSLGRIGTPIPWEMLEPLTTRRLYSDELLMALGRSGAVEAVNVVAADLETDPAAARALELLHESSVQNGEAVEKLLAQCQKTTLKSLVEFAQTERQAATRCLLWSRRVEMMPQILELARFESLYTLLVAELKKWGTPAINEIVVIVQKLDGKRLASALGLLARLLNDKEGRARSACFASYLESDDEAVATAAAGALARFGDEQAIERLIDLADATDKRVRRVAGFALTELGGRHPKAVREKIKDIELTGPRGIVLARVLAVVGLPKDMNRLAAVLTSPDAELRRVVLSSLASIAGAGAIETIAMAMTDEDLGVRMSAAEALGRVGPVAAETIVSALHIADGPLKAALVRALGLVGHSEASRILAEQCRGSSDVALASLEAMQRLGLDLNDVLDEILNHPDGEVIKQALLVAGSDLPVSSLVELLGHPSWDVRLVAIERLEAAPIDQVFISTLELHLVGEQNDLVKVALTRALRKMKKES